MLRTINDFVGNMLREMEGVSRLYNDNIVCLYATVANRCITSDVIVKRRYFKDFPLQHEGTIEEVITKFCECLITLGFSSSVDKSNINKICELINNG
jgi:hypothetical protein